MAQFKVSVIIPVYNAEKYIEKCVRTLFSQTLDDIEFIFIDDKSPDKSIEIVHKILEEYPNRQPQVKFITHENNQGVSKSRQDGIDSATGEYIIHCDADDWVEYDMYEFLYKKAKETDADLVISDFYHVLHDSITRHKQEPLELNSLSVLESMSGLKSQFIHGALWNKLVRNEMCKLIKFPLDICYGEDLFFWFVLLKKNIRIEYVNKAFYYYRDNPTSIIHSFSENSIQKTMNLVNYLDKMSKEEQSLRYTACCRCRIVLLLFWRVFWQAKYNTNNLIKRMPLSSQRYIFKNHRMTLSQKIIFFFAANGFYNQAKLLKKIIMAE